MLKIIFKKVKHMCYIIFPYQQNNGVDYNNSKLLGYCTGNDNFIFEIYYVNR